MDNWNEDFSEDENENSTLLSILEDEISDVEHVGALVIKHGLKRTKQTEAEQMVRVFLSIVGHAEGNRMKQERFQHSGETISRYFHKVLHVYLNLSVEYIKPQDPTFCHVPTKFKDDR
ncbi:hypothetical protein GmHk_08G023024 [Glycine max]|nr:hypothetical protein GmHk_08G023024 [Glycine max]